MFQEIGRNYATTFKGFCDYHDTVVFQDIETRNFNGETIQFFEYAYRGLTHRLYEENKTFPMVRHQVTIMSGEELRNENKKTGFLGRLKLKELGLSDLEKEKDIFDNAIMTQNYDILVNFCFELPYEVKFACTDRFVLDIDLLGKKINDSFSLSDEDIPKSFYLSIIPENGKTLILFSALKENFKSFESSIKYFKNSSMNVKHNILMNLIFRYSDMIVISPALLDKLTDLEKDKLIGVFYNFIPYEPIPKVYYYDLEGEYLPNLFLIK